MAVAPLSHAQQEQDRAKCTVSGVYALVLRVSSIFGMAPLRFKSRSNGYTVSLSNYMSMYSYLLITALAGITFVGVGAELMLGLAPSMLMSSYVSQIVFTCDVIMVPVVAGIGVYGARGRMRSMMKFMGTIASVDKSVSALYSQAKERRLWAALIFCLAFFIALKAHDLFFHLVQNDSAVVIRAWDVVIHHFLWFQVMILEVQFAFTTLLVQTRFKALNDALSFIASHLSAPNMQKAKSTDSLNLFTVKVAPSDSHSEKATAIVKKSGVLQPPLEVIGELRLVISPSDAIHRIACLHDSLCDVVNVIDQGYSIPLILILISSLIHLIVVPYFMILQLSAQGSTHKNFLISQTLWITMLILRLLMVLEPCHYTVVEGKNTESLVCRLMLVSPSSGPLPARLELFSRQLMMQSLSYNPMGLCTLGRPLIASIFGAVATYLVILIQFQKTDT